MHISARFVDCAVANDYVSAGGTWRASPTSCEDAFVAATDDCLEARYQNYDAGSEVPAYALAGYVTKAGTIDAYLGVPESDQSGKVSAVEGERLRRGGGSQSVEP